MLPSRLFRNIGLAPPLRSLITPHASLPASMSVQIRLRLGVGAYSTQAASGGPQTSTPPNRPDTSEILSNSNTEEHTQTQPSLSASSSSSQLSTPGVSSHTHQLHPDPPEPRLSLTFTCTAPNCSTRSSHTFTKQAYQNGIVLVQCPGCKNRHLIADHLSWFKDSTDGGRLRTVEDLVKARGEKVRRGELKIGGNESVIEFTE